MRRKRKLSKWDRDRIAGETKRQTNMRNANKALMVLLKGPTPRLPPNQAQAVVNAHNIIAGACLRFVPPK